MSHQRIKAGSIVCVFPFLLGFAAAPSAAADDVSQLKEQVAAQQKEIQELRAELEEQRKLLDHILPAVQALSILQPDDGASARLAMSQSCSAVEVASTQPVVPRPQATLRASAATTSLDVPSTPQNVASTTAGQSDLELVKGELEAVAETANQTNQRLASLEKDVNSAPVLAGWNGSHPYIRSQDGNFEMELGGRAQLDFRGYTGTSTPPSSFIARRARLEAQGQLFKHYEYKVEVDFADTRSTLLRDGYLNINCAKEAQVQFGHFKAPFSQEELQTSRYYEFVERSSVNGLVPGRSPGVMLHGELYNGAIAYFAGAFNGRGNLAANTASTPEAYVRLRFTPLKGLSFGGALADGRHNNDSSFSGRTASRSATFFSPVPVNGEIVRANAEFWWLYKNFSLRGEYDQTHQARENLAGDGINLPGVIGKGLVLQTTYLLTGEEKTEGGVTPKRSLLDRQHGPGAWELAFRYENLQMHDSVNPNRADAFTLGVNWWLTKFVRYQSNFAFERFKDPATAPTPGETGHFSYLSRMQVFF